MSQPLQPMLLQGRQVVVMGLGKFGGGVGAARFAVQCGAHVLVTDLAPAEKLARSLRQLAHLPITYRLGEHRSVDFEQADVVIVNPAVKPDHELVELARKNHVAITTEIELLIRQLPNRQHVIGITGSAGKSTTTTLIGTALQAALGDSARVYVGGNLGGSLLTHVAEITEKDWVVLELSSFMLEHMKDLAWSPGLAVVTSFAPNHLDWHGSIENYRAAKQQLLDHQQRDDQAIVASDLSQTFHCRVSDPIRVQAEDWPEKLPLTIPGRHNRANAALASATVKAAIGQLPEQAINAIQQFPGLPHRLQLVAERSEVRFYNDSKSTTPEAAILALRCFEPGRVHVILGGYDKGADIHDLVAFAMQRTRSISLIGATAPALYEACQQYQQSQDKEQPTVYLAGDLASAMHRLASTLRRGDVVLLSPGFASWDQYESFEQRGEQFTAEVLRITSEEIRPPR